MKTKIYIMILMFAFSAGNLIASGISLDRLAPTSPAIAEFTDGKEVSTGPEALIVKLAPIPPKEAFFEDPESQGFISINLLSPTPQQVPDFEDAEIQSLQTSGELHPSTPKEADFKE
ncbi:MAG: hypothetical protein Q8M08_09785 [Bacteroidales bacterium]|nr:hypothetical protein [Bacteroidales bacterium]